MAGFGGAVKLTGETAYRKALKDITQNLKEVNSEMKLVTAQYGKNDTSTEALTAKSEALNKKLEQQKNKVSVLQKQYADMAQEYDKNKEKNDALANKYEEQKQVLSTLESTLGTTSNEYQEQAKKVQELEEALTKSQNAQDSNARTMSNLRIQLNNAEADVAKTTNEIKNIERQLEEGADASDEMGDSLREAGHDASSAEGGFTLMKGALANLVADGIRATIDALKGLVVESSNAYAQFSASTGIATDAMGDYKEAIDNVYKSNFGENLEDVANAMGKVKNATKEVDPSKLEEMTEKAMTLEDVFGMDLDETIRGVNSLMNHFGISSDEAFDLMASGAQNGLNYTDELGDNLSEYAGKFAEAGYSAEEYFQLLQNGTEGGAYNLDKVNDAINEVTTRLADGTIEKGIGGFSEKTQELFKNWQDGKVSQKDVIDSIVSDIQNAKGEQEKMNLSALAFGTMAEDGGTKFTQSLTTVGDKYKEVQGKADQLANTKYDTPLSAIQGLGRTIEMDLLQPMVNKLMPTINKIVEVATKGIQWITTNGKELIAVVAGITTAVATYVAYTTALKVMENGWKALTVVTKAQAIAQTALNAIMEANPIGIVIALIAGLVAAFVVLWNKSEKFREFWIGLWEIIKATVAPVLEGIQSAFASAWDSIKSAWSSTVAFFQTIWSGIQSAFAPVVAFFGNVFGTAWKGVQAYWSIATGYFSAIWDTIKGIFSVVKDVLTGDFSGAWNGIKGIVSTWSGFFANTWNTIKGIFNPVISFFRDKFSGAWNAIKNVFSPFASFFSGLWNRIAGTFKGLGTTIGNAIGGAVKSAINSVISSIENTINHAIGLINSAIGLINKLPGVHVGNVGNLRLPRLAKGGVVDGATIAEIGEAGAEAVVPLENNTGWITKIATQLAKSLVVPLANATQSVASANQAQNGYTETVEAFKDALGQMKIVLDDEELGNFVEKTVEDAIYT